MDACSLTRALGWCHGEPKKSRSRKRLSFCISEDYPDGGSPGILRIPAAYKRVNEWNRTYADTYTEHAGICNDIKNLPAGNGGQVVSLQNTKWYYGGKELFSGEAIKGYSRSYVNTYEKENIKTVAYDYWGWDSPFSFRSKMNEQSTLKKQLSENKSEEISSYMNMIFPTDYKVPEEGAVPSLPYKSGDLEYPKFLDCELTRSEVATLTDDSTVELHPYLPGISDAIVYIQEKNGVTKIYEHPGKQMSRISAGTDCNGLIQSAASYDDEGYKAMSKGGDSAVKKYHVEPNLWDTNDGSITESVMSYWYDSNCASIVLNKNDTVKINLKDKNDKPITKDVYKKFKYLVPGDIVNYTGHVMMVSSIDEPNGYDSDGEPYWNDGSGVHIIESVYNLGRTEGTKALFGVGKNRTLKMLNILDKEWNVWRQK